jgi:hypothetical protein
MDNWKKISLSYLTGEILRIPIRIKGEKYSLIGLVHDISSEERKMVIDCSKFKQNLPIQYADVALWHIHIQTLEGEIELIDHPADILVNIH